MSSPGDPSGDAVTSGVGDAVTLGVEEEFQLLDVETGHVVSRAPAVLAALPAATPPEWVQGELTQSQVEIATPVCRSLDELRAHLEHWRRVTSEAAAQAGCVLAASGTPPAGDWREQRSTRSQRYLPLRDGMRHLVDEQLIAGCHVHVGVSSPDLRVAVLDRLRAWMPVLIALTANSPLWLGVDTGFASWRTVHWWRWPVSGPPPAFGTAHDYDQRVAALTATGVAPDESKVYWDVRLSARYPTVEVRATDVCRTVDETLMVAGLVRGLARVALREHASGRPAPDPPPELMRAATYLAARDGLSDRLVDPVTGRPIPAREAVSALMDRCRPELDATGDLAVVEPVAGEVLRSGTASQRQREAWARGGPQAVLGVIAAAEARL